MMQLSFKMRFYLLLGPYCRYLERVERTGGRFFGTDYTDFAVWFFVLSAGDQRTETFWKEVRRSERGSGCNKNQEGVLSKKDISCCSGNGSMLSHFKEFRSACHRSCFF